MTFIATVNQPWSTGNNRVVIMEAQPTKCIYFVFSNKIKSNKKIYFIAIRHLGLKTFKMCKISSLMILILMKYQHNVIIKLHKYSFPRYEKPSLLGEFGQGWRKSLCVNVAGQLWQLNCCLVNKGPGNKARIKLCFSEFTKTHNSIFSWTPL